MLPFIGCISTNNGGLRFMGILQNKCLRTPEMTEFLSKLCKVAPEFGFNLVLIILPMPNELFRQVEKVTLMACNRQQTLCFLPTVSVLYLTITTQDNND